VRSSIGNAKSASSSTLEPNVWASNNIAQIEIETDIDREMREDCLDSTANDNIESAIQYTDSWMDNMFAGSRNSTTWPGLGPPRFRQFPSFLSTMMPISSRQVPTVQCKIWQRSNTIYSQVSKVSAACSSDALKLSSTYYAAAIFKAVIKGWATLSIQERSNPILRILRDIDQVFPRLDPTSRVAFMYKSHTALKVRFKLVPVIVRIN
jgi:hypothetical protein